MMELNMQPLSLFLKLDQHLLSSSAIHTIVCRRCVHDKAISSVHCMATAGSRPLDVYRAVVVHTFVVCEAVPSFISC